MKKLKDNRVLLVLALILLICFALIGVALFKYFYSGNNSNKYGDRLEGISGHPIHEGITDEIKSIYVDGEIDDVKVKVNGKIVYLSLNLSEVKKIEDAKSLAMKSLEKFTDDEKTNYDIQFILTCTKESESSSMESKLYPTMGYKNATSSVVIWIES